MFKCSKPDSTLYCLRFSGPLSDTEQESFLHLLDELSGLSTPYVVLVTSEGNSPLSPDNKKRMNLWFKENKTKLAEHCLGHVRVQPGFTEDHYDHSNLAKALPFPLRAAGSYEEGLEVAQKLLNTFEKKNP